MIATYGMATFREADPARATQAFEQFEALYRQQPGFLKNYWLFNDDTRQYGFFTLWESQAAAEAARTVIGPQRLQVLTSHGFVPQDETVVGGQFQVYEATSSAA